MTEREDPFPTEPPTLAQRTPDMWDNESAAQWERLRRRARECIEAECEARAALLSRDVLKDEVDEDPDAPTGPYVLTQRALKDAGVCLSDEQLDERLPIPTEVTMENLGKAFSAGVTPADILWGLYCGLDLPREVILSHVSWMVGRVLDAAASAKPYDGEDELAHRQWIQSRVMRAIEGIAINCAEQSGLCIPHQSYKEERRDQCRALVRMLEKK